MVPIQRLATGVLAEVIRRQPASRERTTFAWQLAVGPALARSSVVDLRDGVLTVRARDPQWAKEISRAGDTILIRLQHLLGPAAVSRLDIRSE
jgi:predicted nucleic acid-binding Zn ribbon protein